MNHAAAGGPGQIDGREKFRLDAEMMCDDTTGHIPVFNPHRRRQQAIDVGHFKTGIMQRRLRRIRLQLQRRTVGHAADTRFADADDGCF